MQSWMALLVAGMLIGPVMGSPVALATTSTVSADVEAIVAEAHGVWLDSLGARTACSAGASIIFAELDGRRGEYRTRSAEVVIDPTASTAGLDAIVIHELSHHTFLACGAFADAEFSAAFYAAQGLPAERDWFDYSHGWSATPAEHFAEAMAVATSGSGEGGIAVSGEAQSIIVRWLAGAAVSPPAPATHEPEPYSAGGVSTAPVAPGGRADTPPPSAAEPTIDNPAPVSLEVFGEVLTVIPRSQLTKVFWLNSWRVVGPI